MSVWNWTWNCTVLIRLNPNLDHTHTHTHTGFLMRIFSVYLCSYLTRRVVSLKWPWNETCSERRRCSCDVGFLSASDAETSGGSLWEWTEWHSAENCYLYWLRKKKVWACGLSTSELMFFISSPSWCVKVTFHYSVIVSQHKTIILSDHSVRSVKAEFLYKRCW